MGLDHVSRPRKSDPDTPKTTMEMSLMMALVLTDTRRVWGVLAVRESPLVAHGFVASTLYRFPSILLVSMNLSTTPSCSWEDEDDLTVNPEDFIDQRYGSLDELERLGGHDDSDEYDDDKYEEDDDYRDEEEDEDGYDDEEEDYSI